MARLRKGPLDDRPIYRRPRALGSGRKIAAAATPSLIGDFIVSAVQELNKADAMAEWIGHVCDAAPAMGFNLALLGATRCHHAADGRRNVGNGEVEVHGCPMPTISAHVV